MFVVFRLYQWKAFEGFVVSCFFSLKIMRLLVSLIILCVIAGAVFSIGGYDLIRNFRVGSRRIRNFEEFGVKSRSLSPTQRDSVLVFGMATADCVVKLNEMPAACALIPPSTEREMQSLTEGVVSLDAAFDRYAAECNQMVFGEGIKKKFLVFRPNR